ncbi:alanine racemase [Lentilactobacillus senioris]|uniref:alanine racemase n=1 Tax=Lentilactobacillus senioris TaxID=931534 RepID=UPI00228168C9|nr:alanine racemase [Lentilactobacillus senioris]MCY9807568.1 alanine racemase [Lentilactobacillus senioris]
MAVGNHRFAQLIIDQQAIYENIKNAKQNLPDGDELFMTVKANGYGHGAIQVAHVAQRAGADGFCVSIIDEALELRRGGIAKAPILVLGIGDAIDVKVAADNNVSLTAASSDWLEKAAEVLELYPVTQKVKIHLALDTGMGRIGFQTAAELQAAIEVLEQHSDVMEWEGLFTHFATADDPDTEYFELQKKRFTEMMKVVKQRPKYVHIANSATSLWHDFSGSNMIRLGAAGYGLNPSGDAIPTTPYPLKPAMSFVSQLVYTKQIAAGSSVGYGATYAAKQAEWIGTIPVGYADGVPRRLQGFHVLIDGHECEIVGRVCMDQLMVRLPYKMDPGTKVVLMGESNDKKITAEDIAEYIDTIGYDVICGFSARLAHRYV